MPAEVASDWPSLGSVSTPGAWAMRRYRSIGTEKVEERSPRKAKVLLSEEGDAEQKTP